MSKARDLTILVEKIEQPCKCPKCKYVGPKEKKCPDCGEVMEVIGANSLGGISGYGTGGVGM